MLGGTVLECIWCWMPATRYTGDLCIQKALAQLLPSSVNKNSIQPNPLSLFQRLVFLYWSRKHHSLQQLLIIYEFPVSSTIKYCFHILRIVLLIDILDYIHRKDSWLIGMKSFTNTLQPQANRHAVSSLYLFYLYNNDFCSSKLVNTSTRFFSMHFLLQLSKHFPLQSFLPRISAFWNSFSHAFPATV